MSGHLLLAAGSMPADAGADVCVALTPEAMAAADANGQPYTTPETYFTYAELDGFMREQDRSEWFCARLDAILEAALPERDRAALTPAVAHRYYFKQLCDPLFVRTFELERVLRALKPQQVTYLAGEETHSVPHLYHDPDAYGSALAALAGPAGIPMRRVAAAPAAAGPLPAARREAGWRQLRRRGRKAEAALRCALRNLLNRQRQGTVMTTPDCRLGPAVQKLGYALTYLPECTAATIPSAWPAAWLPLAELLEAVRRDREIGAWLAREADLFPLLAPGLRQYLQRLPALLAYARALAAQLTAERIRAVVLDSFSAGAGDARPLAAHAARQCGIPCVSAQHGADGVHARPFQTHYLELPYATTHLVWGAQVRDNLQRVYAATQIAVYGPTHGRLQPQPAAPGRAPLIVCVLRDFRYEHPLYAWDDPAWNYSARTYWQFAAALAEQVCRGRGECRVVIKLYPAERPAVVRLFRERYVTTDGQVAVVSSEESLERLLTQAGLLVCDWLGTPFFQAAPLPCSIIVRSLTRHDPAAERAARTRAAFPGSDAELAALLDTYCRTGSVPREGEDDLFVRGYLNGLCCDRQTLARSVRGDGA